MEIQICKTCKGTGKREEHDYRDTTYVHCENCDGSGKVHVCEMHFTLTLPYTVNKRILYECNSKMFNVFRDCEKEIKEEVKKNITP